MSIEAITPPVLPLPLSVGTKTCFIAASLETVTSLPAVECSCGKCDPLVPHVSIVLVHEVGAPYFAPLPRAAAIRFARELLKQAEALPGPKHETEIEEKRK